MVSYHVVLPLKKKKKLCKAHEVSSFRAMSNFLLAPVRSDNLRALGLDNRKLRSIHHNYLRHSKARCYSAERQTLRPMATQSIVLPGETISPDILPIPSNPKLALKLGPGLRHTPPSTITSVLAGSLCIDQKKNAIWVENNSGRVLLSPALMITFHCFPPAPHKSTY